jgi:hypothetical protein
MDCFVASRLAMTGPETDSRASGCLLLRRQLPQTIRTQAIAGIGRHRQAERCVGAPAAAGQAARKLVPATGAGEAAWFRGF